MTAPRAPRVSEERLKRLRECLPFIDPPSAQDDVRNVIDDLIDARAELAGLRREVLAWRAEADIQEAIASGKPVTVSPIRTLREAYEIRAANESSGWPTEGR